MTDHPKPIARWTAPMGKKHDNGEYVLTRDHEAALAAEQIHRMAAERTIVSRDARIAELETRLRVADGIIEAKNEAIQQSDDRFQARAEELRVLRTAIEALAREWKREAEEVNPSGYECDGEMAEQSALERCASELLALLETKP